MTSACLRISLVCLLMFAAAAVAQLAGAPTYDLKWSSIDGGGGTSAGGAYALSGTIGQPDGGGFLYGGAYGLTGGFWPGTTPPLSCEGDVNSNGAVGVDDLVAVIVGWGACQSPCPPHCSADVAPWPGGNCLVNADDLLAIITNWGPCL